MPTPTDSSQLLIEATIRTCCLRLERWAKRPPAALLARAGLPAEQLSPTLRAAAAQLRTQLPR